MDRKRPPDPIFVFRGSQSSISTVKFAPKTVSNAGLLVSGSSKGVVNLWDIKTKRVQASLDENNGKGILGLEINETSKLISHGRDGLINVYNLGNGTPVLDTKYFLPVFGFCKFSLLQNDGKTLIATASSTQSQIDIVDIDSKEVLYKIKAEDEKKFGMCMCVKLFVCPDKQQLKVIAGFEDGCIRLFDVRSERMECQLKVHTESVMSLDVDLQGRKVISGSADSKLVVAEILPKNEFQKIGEVELKNPGIADVKIRHDCKIVCTGGWDGRIRVFSWKTLKPLAILNCHTQTVNSIDFSPYLDETGVLMAAGSKDSKISAWSIYN